MYCAEPNGADLPDRLLTCSCVQNMRLGIDAVGTAGGIVEAAVCYTGDITDTSRFVRS